MFENLTVNLGDRAYPIYIGSGLIAHTELYARHISGQQILVVSNETVAATYLSALQSSLASSHTLDICLLPDGEQYKTLETYAQVIDVLMSKRHNRTTTLLALGGGVVGDITGFAAATYQRGVGFIQVPTTLLAQVDSSVGGKTGVNHPGGKNMLGAFYQPQCVVIDTDVLNSLPEREFSAGLAEVIKYGLIRDGEFFSWLASNMSALRAKEPDVLVDAIKKSCEIKALVVAQDEREKGIRAILNFGHTFGHAIEKLGNYQRYLHGEAVAIGMVMAADLSQRSGLLPAEDVTRLTALLLAAGLPVSVDQDLDTQDMLSAMGMDKKVIDGVLRLILIDAIGSARISEDVEPILLEQTLRPH